MHVTKLSTAMKATRSALVGFLLSLLAWQVRRCRSTSVDRAYIYIYTYYIYIIPTYVRIDELNILAKKSGKSWQIIQFLHRVDPSSLRAQLRVDPLDDGVVV